MRAGDPDRSVLAFRMESRNPVSQMPPVGSQLVDEEAVALIRRWIAEDLGATINKTGEQKRVRLMVTGKQWKVMMAVPRVLHDGRLRRQGQ